MFILQYTMAVNRPFLKELTNTTAIFERGFLYMQSHNDWTGADEAMVICKTLLDESDECMAQLPFGSDEYVERVKCTLEKLRYMYNEMKRLRRH